MYIVSKTNSIDKINDLSKYSDFIMVEYKFINIEIVNEILKFNKTPILMFNLMVHPFEISKYFEEIKQYSDMNVLFYITDLGLARLIKNNGFIDKVIYDPITMITNSLDAKNYYDYGFKAIGLSNEITKDDIKKINDKTNINSFIQVFGYRLMLHSRRKLVSLYKEKINDDSDNLNMKIIESTRNDEFPIVENEFGTFIYRGYIIDLLKVIKDINVNYLYLDDFNIEYDIYLKVLDIYRKYIDGIYDVNLAYQHMILLDLNIKDGFLYQDSIYNKGEF